MGKSIRSKSKRKFRSLKAAQWKPDVDARRELLASKLAEETSRQTIQMDSQPCLTSTLPDVSDMAIDAAPSRGRTGRPIKSSSVPALGKSKSPLIKTSTQLNRERRLKRKIVARKPKPKRSVAALFKPKNKSGGKRRG